jgi:AcrR family transcriptional regulator
MLGGDVAAQPRELLLEVAERLMSERGYAATSVSAICKQAGAAVTSLYWHFGSKEGLLAAVMERGAQHWFAALPQWDELDGDTETRAETVVRAGADTVGGHPTFLRLFYMLALEKPDDKVVAELISRVRRRATTYFHDMITAILSTTTEPAIARAAAADLAQLAVAFSDGCFFAAQLEPATADLHRMYADLLTAVRALAPPAIDRARRALTSTDDR